MRRVLVVLAALFAFGLFGIGPAAADGPSGSTECHLKDDDCDGAIDEDPAGDANGDGNLDDDGDGAVDEDLAGDAADDPNENQTNCNESGSTNVGGLGYLSAGGNGAEVCADEGSAVPIDGRIVVSAEDGYVAIDGDNSNPAPANGYARLDQNGVHCGDTDNQDSGADQSGNTPEDCG
jgi:hypothetical protein